jgi:hypothetical protein
MTNGNRKEVDIFTDLSELCSSPGYVYAIAYLCFRDNTIKYTDTVTTDEMPQKYSMDRLVRNEMSTLIGLACKAKINTDIPSPDVTQQYIEKTDSLLKELHQSMVPPLEKIVNKDLNPFRDGGILRENIFYGGETAYDFQYRDLSKAKYKNDNDWFVTNKHYTIQQAIDVITLIQGIQVKKLNELMQIQTLVETHFNEQNFFSTYKFTLEEVNNASNIDAVIVKSVIESFVTSLEIGGFDKLDDFNPTNAYPIIKLNENEYLLFQNYSLVEALYETPFFWFNEDENYKQTAMKHRGEFTEKFSAERLKRVFGDERVFVNIDIHDSKKTKVGEIDVLVIFANRAIILQAKSKKLTIAARQGNDNRLQDDFKKAVQGAYDQAYLCATFLNDDNYKLIDSNGNEIIRLRKYNEIYPFCVVSDHYPSLSLQAREFLIHQETNVIKTPFIMDVFFLDVMTEILQSPLYFMSYVNRRTTYGNKVISNCELTILSYHLQKNLWIDTEDLMVLYDDICADLDLAMLARRDLIPGNTTPKGILTKYKDTAFNQIICDIDKLNNPAIIDLGLMLLSLSSNTIEMINDGISQLISDRKHHDFTLGIREGNTGLTIHCNDDRTSISVPRLEDYCERRKYSSKANTWFGICIGTRTPILRFGISKEYEWVQSSEMDEVVKDMKNPQILHSQKRINFKTQTRKSKKIGRNEKCPCGSGKKHKKCCLSRSQAPAWECI